MVIASWNSWKDLEPCLKSFINDPGAVALHTEVVVVDNGSRDGTPDRLGRDFPSVRLLRNQTNLGHSRAVNQGLEVAAGDYVIVLDADTVVEPGVSERSSTSCRLTRV